MGTGWRRAFCTSVRRDPDKGSDGAAPVTAEKQSPRPSPSPRSFSKLGSIFSGVGSYPSTPRLQSETAASTPRIRFRTRSSPTDSPKLQCKTARACTQASSATTTAAAAKSKNPGLIRAASSPSSPISPSRFALFKAALRLSRTRCGICAQSVKTGHGTAVFTAECSHAFHFPCIASHIRNQGGLVCPVCSAIWRQAPLLSSVPHNTSLPKAPDLGPHDHPKRGKGGQWVAAEHRKPHTRTNKDDKVCGSDSTLSKAYDDDEPLLASPTTGCGGAGGTRFHPIPEADDEDDDGVSEGEKEEFRGFFVNHSSSSPSSTAKMSSGAAAGVHHRSRTINCSGVVEVRVMPVVALVSSGKSHQNYVVALKVRVPCPPPPTASSVPLDPLRRAPIDLVTVLDVSCNMDGAKLCMLKRAMRLLISTLGPSDRLAVVAFSSAAKRLLPLRRMSQQGQRSARQIVDRLVVCAGNQGQSPATSVSVALKKATKVLDDRRERNPVATIMLLSDGQQQGEAGDKDGHRHRRHGSSTTTERHHSSSATTRFAHLEIPIHESGFGDAPRRQKPGDMSSGDAFAKCVGGLLSVVLQDVHLQLIFPAGEVSVVYSCGGGYSRAMTLGVGSAVRLGDLYAEEERELLVELRVPAAAVGWGPHQYPMSIRCSYRDPATQELICCGEQPLLLPPLSSSPNTERLRNLFVTTRALAESRRLVELSDYATAVHLLSSARSLLLQFAADDSLLRSLEGELANLQHPHTSRRRVERREETMLSAVTGDSREPLTPTSAWRAAERLAKVAIMRKSQNRVSDLHGFENARF